MFENTYKWWGKEYDFSQLVAHTYLHELGHNLGIRGHTRGRTMEGIYEDWIIQEFSNAKYPVEFVKPKLAVPKEVAKLRKYDLALSNLKKAATRLKRAKTLFIKWTKKAKRLEVQLQPAAAIKNQQPKTDA